jgi:hypothetical protein
MIGAGWVGAMLKRGRHHSLASAGRPIASWNSSTRPSWDVSV